MTTNRCFYYVLSLLTLLSCLDLSAKTKTKTTKEKEAGGLAFIIAVDNQEIDAAKNVEGRVVNPKVKAFAEFMIKEHTKNLEETKALSKKLNIAPVECKKTKAMKKEGEKELKTLKSLKGMALDKAYINAMVKGHQHVLDKLNKCLSHPHHDADYKKLLENTKKHVVDHLQKAKELKKELAKAPKKVVK